MSIQIAERYNLRLTIITFLLCLGITRSYAQMDPTLTGLIFLYTDNAKKELKAQERSMLLETTGHIWLEAEWDETAKIQERYTNYLDQFRSIIVYAAEIYGFYHEVSMMTDAMGGFIQQLDKHPTNALAVALSAKRNSIYRELILTSVDIVNDIRMVCLSDIKMTEKERVEIVFAIRPKLKQMNNKLRRLTRVVKYTTLADVWREIEGSAYKPKSKTEIAERAIRDWRYNGRKVK
mgnify:FL=1